MILQTDNGAEFYGYELEEVCKMFNVKQIYGSDYSQKHKEMLKIKIEKSKD